MKYGFILVGLVVLGFGSCMIKPQPDPIIQVNTGEPAAAPVIDDNQGTEIQEGETAEEMQLRIYNGYSQNYLASLAAANDQAEAEWNTYEVCRAAAIAASASQDALTNNTGFEPELLKRLRAVNAEGKQKSEGLRFYSHDGLGADHFRGPGSDAKIILTLLQEMQGATPAMPLCSQPAGGLWPKVQAVLDASDDLARGKDSIPVSVPVESPQQEVVKNEGE